MEFKRYEKSELIHINSWLEKRSLPPAEASDMPEFGYIAYEDDTPVCAAFLRRCEGSYAILDGLVTNPDILGSLRNFAIDTITEMLVFLGRELGLKSIICFSVDESTIARAKRHGFKEVKYLLMKKNLSLGVI